MRTYRGERLEHGCEVTVDGKPLVMRSDLSGNATTPFDWGYVGGGQLSLALLCDFLGDDRRAEAMAPAFERVVVANLPRAGWTMTEHDLAAAVAPFNVLGTKAARGNDAAFGDMPIHTAGLGIEQ